jgi:hypothetical protein
MENQCAGIQLRTLQGINSFFKKYANGQWTMMLVQNFRINQNRQWSQWPPKESAHFNEATFDHVSTVDLCPQLTVQSTSRKEAYTKVLVSEPLQEMFHWPHLAAFGIE